MPDLPANLSVDTIIYNMFPHNGKGLFGYELCREASQMLLDPKRIQRRLRTTQNSQKQLRMLRMASTDREREKIQSSQNSVKMTSSRRVRRKISNGANDSSNRVTDRKIFVVKVWST
jgi:hypothetical protein